MSMVAKLGILASLALAVPMPASASVVIVEDEVGYEISDLKDFVQELVWDEDLTPSQGALLSRLLDSALLRHNQGRDASAIQLLHSFQAYVGKFVDAEILDEEYGWELWEWADYITWLIEDSEPL